MNQQHPRPDILRLLERRARLGLTYRELSEESGIPSPMLAYWASKQRRERACDGDSQFALVRRAAWWKRQVGSARKQRRKRGSYPTKPPPINRSVHSGCDSCR